MPLSRRVGAFSVELWVTVIVMLVLIVLFMRSFNSTYDDVDRLKPTKLAEVMEVALRQLRASWLATNQPQMLVIDSGQSLVMSAQGYPTGVAGESSIEPGTGCVAVLQLLLGEALPRSAEDWPVLTTAVDGGECQYEILYESGHSFELRYDTTTGKVRAFQAEE
ncbi:MAG: hypothetical protein CME36_16485 [unclassified Hahellaceae]|nr:hypothetical protein [Hahellaceae bacterium]|tara:strand:- start:173502 stop:173993 length:492 start_codon:yes stop_codon:yes gene_type:complete